MSEKDLQDLVREEKNRYQREWRAANKDRVREINARYWAKRAAKKAAEKEAEDAASRKARA